MATGALVAAQPKLPSLQDQIRQQWGGYGDWRSADQDQVADLARLLEANGITDLSKLQITPRDYTIDPEEVQTESGPVMQSGASGTAFDVTYDGKPISFLGDINRDGSIEMKSAGEFGVGRGSLRGDGDLLAWSARGGGNTSFRVMRDPETGRAVVAPVWGSSRSETYDDIRGIATVAAAALGANAAFGGAGAGAAAPATTASVAAPATTGGINWGAVGSGALKSAGVNAGLTLAQGGDLGDALKSGAIGAVTGGLGAGLSTGFNLNPIATNAVTGGVGAALRGGDGKAILTGAATGAVSGIGKTGITGNEVVDRAITGGANAAIRGGSGKDILTGALVGAGNAAFKGSSSKSLAAGEDMKLEPGFFDEGGDGYARPTGSEDMYLNFDDDALFGSGGGDFDPNADSDPDLSGRVTDPTVDDTYRDEGRNYPAPPDYGNEGRNYPTPESTQGEGGSPSNSSMENDSIFDSLPSWAKDLWKGIVGGGSSGGGGSYMGGSFGRDLMMLLAGGIQAYGIDKMAREQRDWQAKQEAEKRRRQMPVGALPSMQLRVNRGGQ